MTREEFLEEVMKGWADRIEAFYRATASEPLTPEEMVSMLERANALACQRILQKEPS